MDTESFKNEVLSYKGKYNEKELYKFIKYFTERKHFSKFKTFVISRRLQTWFDPKRKKKFNESNKSVNESRNIMNILGLKAKIEEEGR